MASLFLALLCVCFASLCSASLSCGDVRDGPIPGYDTDIQPHGNSLSASWDAVAGAKHYQWAIISHSKASQAVKERHCRDTSGIEGKPDIKDWTTTSELKAKHNNAVGAGTYYFLVKAVGHDGAERITNSDGLTVAHFVESHSENFSSSFFSSSSSNNSGSSDDDDDDLDAWEIGLIAMGCALFLLLLIALLLLLLLLKGKGGGSDKYQTNVNRSENVEAI